MLQHQHCLLALPRVFEVIQARWLVHGDWPLFFIQNLLEKAVILMLGGVYQISWRLVLKRAADIGHALVAWLGTALAAVHSAIKLLLF
jgi:hypothetical protein